MALNAVRPAPPGRLRDHGKMAMMTMTVDEVVGQKNVNQMEMMTMTVDQAVDQSMAIGVVGAVDRK